MEQLYDSSALDIIPMSDGMVFAYCQDKTDEQMTIAFKMISFESGVMTNVTSDFYSIAKFGTQYQSCPLQIDNIVTCKIANLPNGNILYVNDKGDTVITDGDGNTVFTGLISHKGNAVSGVAVDNNSIWCSFKDSGIIIRYNARTMRDELRLGGGRTPIISAPKGISIEDGLMKVCDVSQNKIFEIDLNSYSMKVYKEFDEPVHQYIKIRSYEFVLLDSGLYML